MKKNNNVKKNNTKNKVNNKTNSNKINNKVNKNDQNNGIMKLIKSNIKPIIITTVSILLLLIGSFTVGFKESLIVIIILDIMAYLILMPKKRKKSTAKDKLKTFLIIMVCCMIILLILFATFMGYIIVTAPDFDPNLLYTKESSVLYDKDGNEIGKIGGSEIRVNVTYDELSESLIDAIIATEDSRFFQHSGVDLPRFIKASISQVLGKGGGGASTLTMQVSKNTYTSREDEGIKGIIRKFSDIYMAVFKIETHYTKEEILEFYVNSNTLGYHISGVEQASLTYFNKHASELNLSESAMLAGMFQAPIGYEPYTNPTECEERRQTVLYLMLRHGYITKEEYDIALELSVDKLLVEKKEDSSNYQSFIDTAASEVMNRFGVDPYKTPLKIYTTMDRDMQNNMNDVFSGKTYKWVDEKIQAGSVVLDVNDGSIRALGAGRNYVALGTNRATDITRQIGSTAKPLYDYGPYIEYNNGSTYTIFTDEPYSYSDGGELVNFDYKFIGTNTLHDALMQSRNIPAIKAFQSVKNSNIKNFVTNLGLSPEVDSSGMVHESHALGGYEPGESPLSMAGAYAAFSNGGYYNEPHSVTKIVYIETNEEEEVKPTKKRVMSESTAYMITSVLEDTGSYAIGKYVNGVNYCGKTGTTNLTRTVINDYGYPSNAIRDRWIMSYNNSYVISLWYGYDELYKDYYLTMSKSDHKNVFQAIAKAVYTKKSTWTMPSSVVKVEVEKDLPTAMLPSEYTPSNMKTTAYFKKGTEPTQTSDRYSKLSNVTNLKYSDGKITWDAIKTPNFIDSEYINKLFTQLYTNKKTRNERIQERINYNNTNIGTIVYEIYEKSQDGTLTLIGTTDKTSYDFNGNGNIVVKTAYTIFKDNRSSGSELIVEGNIITSELNESSTIELKIGDTYTESKKPVIVLENGITDVTDKAKITKTIIRGSDKSEFDQTFKITTTTADTYTIKYKIVYGNYTNTLTQIINVK